MLQTCEATGEDANKGHGRRKHTGQANTGILFSLENVEEADEEAKLFFDLDVAELARRLFHFATGDKFDMSATGKQASSRAGRRPSPLLRQGHVEAAHRGGTKKCPNTKTKRRRSREKRLGRALGWLYLLELKLSTTSVVRIGEQTRSEQAPDGGSVHGDGSLLEWTMCWNGRPPLEGLSWWFVGWEGGRWWWAWLCVASLWSRGAAMGGGRRKWASFLLWAKGLFFLAGRKKKETQAGCVLMVAGHSTRSRGEEGRGPGDQRNYRRAIQ